MNFAALNMSILTVGKSKVDCAAPRERNYGVEKINFNCCVAQHRLTKIWDLEKNEKTRDKLE